MSWGSFGAGVLGSLLASYMFPGFRRVIESLMSFFVSIFSPNSFNLTGTWDYEFNEPMDGDSTKIVKDFEKVRVRQIGNIIWARGETKEYKRCFKYRMRVKHELIFGIYVKKASKGCTSGTGMVQLIVNANRNQMRGCTTWMDNDSNQIESDEVVWRKVD